MTNSTFSPKIIAFCCNWCSYAGADLAGTSRIQYPPNIRIIRVMCSGRVEPSYILNAVEYGADGVLVTGCHPGDCHYISGNEKAEKRVEVTKKLIEMIGLNPDRIHLEWISASEGIKFAAAVREFVDNIKRIGSNPIKKEVIEEDKEGKDIKSLIKETNAYHCIECGKCTGSCPVARINIEYSPERNVERAVFGFKNEIIADRWLWSCLTCRKCSEVCQAGVNYDEFIRGFRNIALGAGNRGNCAHGGTLLALMRLMTNSVPKRRMPWMNEVRTREKGEILYFTGCLPYFEYLFHEIGFDSPFQNIPADITSINLATVRILNEAGISPVLLPNERCCGHDLYWSGDYANFERLARLNVENIKETGAKKVIFSCAEGYRTFKMDYPEVVEDIDFEVVHISEFLADILDEGRIKLDNSLEKKEKERVTYQDPCRLGRHLGVYDAPRKVIESIPWVELVEMEENREAAACCGGPNGWINCSSFSRQMQIKRLMEAKKTEADTLITTCPKCLIHLGCAKEGKLPVEPEKVDISIQDLSILVARAIDACKEV